MLLEEVLRYVNNRFERSRVDGRFRASGGGMDVPGALEGQYYWVEGSVLNDGLHLHPADDLADEEFDGTVWLLAVPRPLVELADEAEAWLDDNAEVLDSPMQSESFGGYSYTRAGSSAGAGGLQMSAWQEHFGGRLRQYRKLSRNWS